jgi:seryl-tRNA synthetase
MIALWKGGRVSTDRPDAAITATLTDNVREFRDALFAAGLLRELGVPGLYARSPRFESIVQGLVAFLDRELHDITEYWLLPPLISRHNLEQTGYVRSFPDLVGSVHVFTGNDRDHAALLERFEAGEDWSTSLTPAGVTLCSAGCHGLYPQLPEVLPPEGITASVIGQCFRHEPSYDPSRMQSFRMHEIVYIGSEEGAAAHRTKWVERLHAMLLELSLPVERVVANDPFFGRAGRILASGQRSEELKFELVCPVATPERPTAIGSANLHRDHFGEAFGIHQASGAVAHSACAAFGLERVVLALLKTHGLDPATWPPAVRAILWP